MFVVRICINLIFLLIGSFFALESLEEVEKKSVQETKGRFRFLPIRQKEAADSNTVAALATVSESDVSWVLKYYILYKLIKYLPGSSIIKLGVVLLMDLKEI